MNATLARTTGFQALLRVWDADKNWVFVQAFDDAWTPVTTRFDANSSAFAEDALRDVVFQVVALVHFLHAHDLSLAGELAPRDLMVRLSLHRSVATTYCRTQEDRACVGSSSTAKSRCSST